MHIVQKLLPIGDARPGRNLDNILAIVLHWPAMPGQHAQAIADFWAGADNKDGASAHCAIDQDGTIVQTVPWTERAYHVGSSLVDPKSGKIYTDLAASLFGDFAPRTLPASTSPNHVTIGIEMCHLDEAGTYTPETVAAAVELCAYLCGQYHVDPATHIIRHIDVVGWKRCPAWYIDHPEDLDAFRQAVAAKMADPAGDATDGES
jgi:N-acetylmuramoyl-L-alanine amidase